MDSPFALRSPLRLRCADQLEVPSPDLGWHHGALAGRLNELSGASATAILSLAFDLVVSAQQAQEPCAWVTTQHSAFFPPDAAARGVDLQALVVIRTPHARGLGRATDHLARSGAFGLILVDLASLPSCVPSCALATPRSTPIDPLPLPLQSRLLGLAQTHDIALVFLTRTPADRSSLGSLISLRAEARRRARTDGSYLCEAHILKDKRHAPGMRHAEVYLGPAGLR